MNAINAAETALLRAIAERTQARVAEVMGISASRFSEAKGEDLVNRTAKLIVACGFRLVPVSEPVYPPGHVQAMEMLARLYMQQQREAA